MNWKKVWASVSYVCLLETAAARWVIELPLCFSYRVLMCCANIHTFVLENPLKGTIIVHFLWRMNFSRVLNWIWYTKRDTLKSLIPKFAGFHLSRIFYATNAGFSRLRRITKCLHALLPRVLLKRRSLLTAWFGWCLSKASATEPGIPGRLPEKSFLCLRVGYRMDCRRYI